MSDESDNFVGSDEEIDDKRHEKLVENVLNLGKVQHIKKPSRTEPTLKISEFDLVKSVTGPKSSVLVNELTKSLKKKKLQISQKLQTTQKKSRTLPKPLEKPQAERIRRAVNYNKTRLDLDRWEGFVTANRAQAHQVFPVGSVQKVKVKDIAGEKLPERWRTKSDLQKELDALKNPQVEVYNVETEDDKAFPLTLAELKEKRQEAAKLRAHQSYKEAKARRQNKIKSKKYHRILRREKIKQKLKEFEELQKTNPEEALKKLDDIEKARAQERFSLRHKSTGQWAKNKQIRAKYDKESRQVLAQQLAISRDLTQKVKATDTDSEDEGLASKENPMIVLNDKNNPWVNGMKPHQEVVDFVSGYRKYWNKKDENGKEQEEEMPESPNKEQSDSKVLVNEEDKRNNHETNVEEKKFNDTSKNKSKKKRKRKTTEKLNNPSGEWQVEKDIEDIFDELETSIKKKIKSKSNVLKSKKSKQSRLLSELKSNKTTKIDLSLQSQSKKHVIDEELLENPHGDDSIQTNSDDISNAKKVLESVVQGPKTNIDPEEFMTVKITNLDTAIPDLLTVDENEENNQRDLIVEAFEDDDIVQDFKKDKKAEIEKDTPTDIDLNLPGWGSWAGATIKPTKRKRRRFIIKMPKQMPRKDDNKGSLIINEKAQAKIREHQVSEVPFPFKTVKDFEASIRAPIGNTFVPESAFRRHIKPAVVTKMGAVIEPMKKSMLVNG